MIFLCFHGFGSCRWSFVYHLHYSSTWGEVGYRPINLKGLIKIGSHRNIQMLGGGLTAFVFMVVYNLFSDLHRDLFIISVRFKRKLRVLLFFVEVYQQIIQHL